MRKNEEEDLQEQKFFESEPEPAKEKLYGEDNYTVVRVWKTVFQWKDLEFEPGHVSVETHHGYISLWPTWKGKTSSRIPVLYHPVEAQLKDYFQDFKAENDTEPDYQIRLFTLDVDKINNTFERIKSNMKGWSLLGSHMLFNRNKAESCASLAWKLLKIGGIYSCIPKTHSSFHSVVNTPNLLLESVMTARQYEIENPKIKTSTCDEDETVERYIASKTEVKSQRCILS